VKIAYVSHVLSVHDYRFLKKLSESQHCVWLITYYSGRELPANILNLPNITIIHRYLHSKWNPRRYMDRRALRLLPYHVASRTFVGAVKRSRLLQKWVAYNDWPQSRRRILRMHSASSLGALQFYDHIARVLCSIKPDIVHAGWVQMDGLLTALADFHPFLLMPWGSDILLDPGESAEIMAVTQYTLTKADMITCDCESVKTRIIEISGVPPEGIVVIPWGIDLSLFNPSYDGNCVRKKLGWSGKKVLIMTRSLAPVYGVEFFLQALPYIIAREPDTRALVLGSGPLDAQLRDAATKLGLSNHVHFAGFILNDQLPQYLNAADIYVSTSLSDGTSLSLLEAMACALPVIVTDVPSNSEWVQEGSNGFIVPRGDPVAVAEKTLVLMKDVALAKRMGHSNLAIARARADWEKNFAKFELMYLDLAARYPRVAHVRH